MSKRAAKLQASTRSHPVLKAFLEALADDLNVSGALGVVFPWIAGDHPDPAESLGVFKEINRVLSVAPIEPFEGDAMSFEGDGEELPVNDLCRQMDDARAARTGPRRIRFERRSKTRVMK